MNFPENPPVPKEGKEAIQFQVGVFTAASENHPNEDNFLSVPKKGFFAVFDGVGGHAAGRVASGMARDYLEAELEKIPENLSREDMKAEIAVILKDANTRILEASNKDVDLSEMATTVALVQFCKNIAGTKKAIIAHAGDSRVYVLRNNKTLEQITTDDNGMSPELQEKFNNVTDPSELTDQEIRFWKTRHLISNCLGRSDYHIRMKTVDQKHGDIIIITSDGIHDVLTSKKIIEIVEGEGNNSLKAERLVQAVKEENLKKTFRSKPDDMTAIVVSEQI